MSTYSPPYPPYDPADKSGFSYETVSKRWPIIVTSLIDTIYRSSMKSSLNSSASLTKEQTQQKEDEGKVIIQSLNKLKYELCHDKELQPIFDDGGPNCQVFNSQLGELRDKGKNTWFTAPWLYAECYLYRLIRTFFSNTTHWKQYDPFHEQKEQTFISSASAIKQLARTFRELDNEKNILLDDPSKQQVLFNEMLQMCLWGNATDLSLLTNMTHEDIQKLQSVGRTAQEERKEFILRDDSIAVWKHIAGIQDGRVDIVLDNAGFELFTDLLLADFLISCTSHVSRVVFHPKTIPWFVSDVLPVDLSDIVPSLLNPSFFPDQWSPDLEALAIRWQEHFSMRKFVLSVPLETRLGEKDALADFWTSPSPFALMQTEASILTQELKQSGLVIFKGDLNYRKLTADVKWPACTPFAEAMGPLAGLFPILSLRTLKADVVVGISEEKAAALSETDPRWRINGKYATISFAP